MFNEIMNIVLKILKRISKKTDLPDYGVLLVSMRYIT